MEMNYNIDGLAPCPRCKGPAATISVREHVSLNPSDKPFISLTVGCPKCRIATGCRVDGPIDEVTHRKAIEQAKDAWNSLAKPSED